jgi:hypothetical protein
MKIAIHQPQYLPWLGYFDKMDQADVFVLLDDVQFKKNEWQNRNKIRNTEGWHWLTVPVLHEFGQVIMDVKIDNRRAWRGKHLKSIELNYSRAPYFKDYFSLLREGLEKEWEFLADLNLYLISRLKEALGIKTELVRSSDFNIRTNRTQRLIDICGHLKADTYISGAGGSDYLDGGEFQKSGIKLEFQNFTHPEYEQLHKDFYPHMSVVDLLFCQGDGSLSIIREGRGQ